MNSILANQNAIINYFYLKKNDKIIRKRKKKIKSFFLKLKLYKKTLEKNKYREIIYYRKKNYFYYKKNREKYLRRKLNAKKNKIY